jgi:pyridoxine 5-phosphate synthase
MLPELIVGVDGWAALRDGRRAADPDPAAAAVLAELAGADGISIHLRSDAKGSNERDVKVLRATVTTRLVVRAPASPEALKTMLPIRPDLLVLVPDRTDAAAALQPYDLVLGGSALAGPVAALREAGLEVLALVAPDVEQVKAAHRLGLHGACVLGSRLGAARLPEAQERELEAIDRCAKLGSKLGLRVHAGGGLTLRCLPMVARLPGLHAVDVGHAACARASLVGVERAVTDMRTCLHQRPRAG